MAFQDESDRAEAVSELPWMGRVRGTLLLLGVMYFLLGMVGAPAMYLASMSDPSLANDPIAPWFGVGSGVLVFGCGGAVGILNFIAANGLKRGRKWAWIVSLCLGGVYTPSICLPFGALILFGLLQADSRAVFLEGRRLDG